MRNLEQKRAKRALDFINSSKAIVGPDGGNILSKIPAMIVADGLLATAAFAKAKGGDYNSVVENIFAHLRALAIVNSVEDLAAQGALELQRATSEALAYANYIKRFGKAKRGES